MLRTFVLVASLLLFLGGVVAILGSNGEPTALSAGWWSAIVFGAIALLLVLERQRYRSGAAERGGLGPGPGDGEEPGRPLEARFRPTDERFVDPSSNRRVRVWIDPATGERRYRTEA